MIQISGERSRGPLWLRLC